MKNNGFIFPYTSKVINVSEINHDVVKLLITKPLNFKFTIGQAVDLSIDKPGYEFAVASFVIVNTPTDDYLEFIIKVYPIPQGFTKSLTKGISKLLPNETVQLSKAWDTYRYNGSGTLIVAGTGITPFVPIFTDMQEKGINIGDRFKLIYASKTKNDILFYRKLKHLFRSKLSIILSRTKSKMLDSGKIDKNYLLKTIQNTEQSFYVCGPIKFEEDVKSFLLAIGVKQDYIQTGHKI